MSSFRKPVGPHSSTVYWRRRALVIAVTLLVVIVVLLIVFGRGGGASSAAGTSSAEPRPVEATSAASSVQPSKSAASSSASVSARPSAAASAKPSAASATTACSKSQITVKPVIDKTAFAATEEPKIAMSITNTGSGSCTADLGSARQVLTITSGSETYWASTDCQTGGTHQTVRIKTGQTLTTPSIAWDRTRSSKTTCDSTRPAVTAGGASYHLQVSIGGFASATSAQFVLD